MQDQCLSFPLCVWSFLELSGDLRDLTPCSYLIEMKSPISPESALPIRLCHLQAIDLQEFLVGDFEGLHEVFLHSSKEEVLVVRGLCGRE